MAVKEIDEDASDQSPIVGLEPNDVIDDLRAPLESSARRSLHTSLERAADTLFDRSRREDSATLCHSCVSAVRALRNYRQTIIDAFRASLGAAIDRGFGHAAASRRGPPPRNQEELQEQAMIDRAVARLREQNSAILQELESRLRLVAPASSEDAIHPFGPEVLVRALAAGLRDSGIELRPRIIVYKAFTDELLVSLDAVYTRLNRELAAAGLSASTFGSASAVDDAAERPEINTTESLERVSPPSDDECAAARINVVRQHVKVAVETRLGRVLDLPEPVCRFLRESWSDVMLRTGIDQGVHGEAWRDQVRVMEWLIRSMQVTDNAEQCQAAEFPHLLQRIREELEGIMRNSAVIEDLMERLCRVYAARHEVVEATGRALVPATERSIPDNVVVANFTGESAGSQEGGELHSAVPEASDDEIKRELAAIALGHWFEFVDSNGRRTRACLQARLDHGQHYIFADDTGQRVADYRLEDLAVAVEGGFVAPLDEPVPATGDSVD